MRIDLLLQWFKKNKRDFPWRNNKSPYAVWVSEVMLQQTQAGVVVDYFERWMKKFPEINILAEAPLAQVLKAWEGLGYYSRAKRLHEGAKQIVKDHQGLIPEDESLLFNISGIGPYTLGAILSFAFEKKKPAIDGNVMRVITRFYAIEAPIEKAATKKLIYNFVLDLLPEKRPFEIMEGLIELGALVCKKNPYCFKCPIKEKCQAFARGQMHLFPVSLKKVSIEKVHRHVYLYLCGKKILVKKPEQDISLMGHLHQLPFDQLGTTAKENLYLKRCKFILTAKEKFSQSFTRYQVSLEAFVYKAEIFFERDGYDWVELKELNQCTFSSGDRKIIHWILAQDLL